MEKHILVLEDEKSLMKAIKIKLETYHFTVHSVDNVEDGLKILETTPIHMIWLDHYLIGKMNGIDFVQKIKSNENWKKIPIFVISNTASKDKIDKYLEMGVNNYYTKSNFRLENIIKDIEAYINL